MTDWKDVLAKAELRLAELEQIWKEVNRTNQAPYPKVAVPYETECIDCEVSYREIDVDNEIKVYEVNKMESEYLCMDCGFTYVDKQIQNTKIRIEMIKERVGE
jgi:DNA-directed RNA polymerase subunit RPC12/RpoP